MSDVATKEYVDQIMATVPLSGTVVAGTSLVGANITKDALREVDEYRRAIVNLESKIQQLEAWKESALAVEREWNPNALATMLGGKLGESHRKVIQREVPKLLARIKRLEEESESNWKLAESAIGSCAEMSSRIKRLEEAALMALHGCYNGPMPDHVRDALADAMEAKP